MKRCKVFFYYFFLFGIVIIFSGCFENKQSTSHRLQWWLEAINWDSSDRTNNLSGKGVRIAIIDTAIDETHPDLQGKISEQHIVDAGSGEMRYEHGTAIAGIICASPSSKEGVLGIAESAEIISIVISPDTEAQLEALIEGIEYAITKKVDIINISAGIIQDDSRLRRAIENACDEGIVVVAAAGNDLYGQTIYPAKYDNVLSVTSVGPNGEKLYGENAESVYLPGGNIVTTYSSGYEPKKYVSYSGTSVSTAMLSGVIALVLEENPNISNKDIVSYFSDFPYAEFDTIKVLADLK